MIKQTFIHIASLAAGLVIIVGLTLIAKCKVSEPNRILLASES
jgi:hypothetical protein